MCIPILVHKEFRIPVFCLVKLNVSGSFLQYYIVLSNIPRKNCLDNFINRGIFILLFPLNNSFPHRSDSNKCKKSDLIY